MAGTPLLTRVRNRVERARLHAVVARRAFLRIDDRKVHVVHPDRVEGAGHGAVGQSHASPRASLAASAHRHGGGAALDPVVQGLPGGDVRTTRTDQACDDL